MNIFRELPEQAMDLPANRVDSYVAELKDEFNISPLVADICAEELHWSFAHYGGFHEPPTEADSAWFRQHNGSHTAGVLGAMVYLVRYVGGNQRQVDAGALGAVLHDKFKSIPKLPSDEPKSAAYAKKLLEDTKYLHRQSIVVPRMIMGTVAKVDKRGIQQAAARSSFLLTRLLADADLANLAAPNTTDLNLRLALEEGENPEVPASTLDFLKATVVIQRKHRYLTWAGRQVLGSLLEERAAQVEREAPAKVKDFYSRQAA